MRLPRLGRVLVEGRSMEPTLYAGDHLLVRWGAWPRPGQLVVVAWPGKPLSVKRFVFRDHQGWWVERDNPAEGTDSWSAGPLPDEGVRAVVLCRVWPWRRRKSA